MTHAVFAFSLFLQAAVPSVSDGRATKELGVRLLPGARASTMSQVEEILRRSWASSWKDNFTVRPGEGSRKWTKVRCCADIKDMDVRAADTRPPGDWDFLIVRAGWCRALGFVQRATAPKQSFLASILKEQNPTSFIPASVVDIVNQGDSPSAPELKESVKAHSSISWAKFDSALKLGDVQTKDSIRLLGKDYGAIISYYATGDFNGDGIEDLLMQISIRSFDASQGDGAFFILTRTKPDELLTIVETFR